MNNVVPTRWRARVLATGLVLSLVAASCGDDTSESGGDGGDGGDRVINVAIVGNPQMEDIAKLTPELFTEETGITVNYSILGEGDLREVTTRDVASGGNQFDVMMIGMFEAPQFGAQGLLEDLTPLAEADESYQLDDLLPSVRGGLSVDDSLYAAPFYAESSFLMYRKDVLEAAGLEMPAAPTWTEVAEIARAVNTPEMAGICLRGKPGWGDLGASFTTVLNTFGGTWWDDSPIKGKLGYALAPVMETDASGWLWSWALAIPKSTSDKDAAWEYVSFATGPGYLEAAGELIDGGWAGIPPGTRASTYEIPEYQEAAAAFAQPTLDAMAAAPIDNPGTTKRPGLPGVQYVGVPEFQDVGNQCTELFSSVIAGQTDIDAALSDCQDIASQVSAG